MDNKKLILIAEDEQAYSKLLHDTLEKEGYTVVVAVNGEELLKIARRRKAAVIVLDLIMPIKNGFQVLTEMKQDVLLKMIPVLILSNIFQEEDIEKAKKLGADDFIIKSDMTFDYVIDKIKKLIKVKQ